MTKKVVNGRTQTYQVVSWSLATGVRMKYILMNGRTIMVVAVFADRMFNAIESTLNRNLDAINDHQWKDGTENDWELKLLPQMHLCTLQVLAASY